MLAIPRCKFKICGTFVQTDKHITRRLQGKVPGDKKGETFKILPYEEEGRKLEMGVCVENAESGRRGIMMYHNNRLIQSYYMVEALETKDRQSFLGVIDTGSIKGIQPTNTKQGYVTTFELEKLNKWLNLMVERFFEEWINGKFNDDLVKENIEDSVMCDSCGKWRRLPAYKSYLDYEDKPFVCSDAIGWDRERASCAAPEEDYSEERNVAEDEPEKTVVEEPLLSQPPLQLDRFDFQEKKENLLGSGRFADVYRVYDREQQMNVAIKKFKLVKDGDDEVVMKMFAREWSNHRKMQNSNIVPLIGYIRSPLCLVMELMPDTLYSKLYSKESKSNLFGEHRRKALLDLARGLQYAHKQGVIHNDVKPSNVLVSHSGTSFQAKVTDFGLSEIAKKMNFSSGHTTAGVKGTFGYLAPEAFLGKKVVGERVDIFGFGVTMLEVLTQTCPCWLEGEKRIEDEIHLMRALFTGKKVTIDIPKNLDRGAIDLISECTKMDPNDRKISWREIIERLRKLDMPGENPPGEVYRLLRWNENPAKGLSPKNKNPNAHVAAGKHVAGTPSPYISFSRGQKWVLWFWCKNVLMSKIEPGEAPPVVKVDVREHPLDLTKVVDISNEAIAVRNLPELESRPRQLSYATCAEEVLYKGHIPRDSIKMVWDFDKSAYGKDLRKAINNMVKIKSDKTVLLGFEEWLRAMKKCSTVRNFTDAWLKQLFQDSEDYSRLKRDGESDKDSLFGKKKTSKKRAIPSDDGSSAHQPSLKKRQGEKPQKNGKGKQNVNTQSAKADCSSSSESETSSSESETSSSESDSEEDKPLLRRKKTPKKRTIPSDEDYSKKKKCGRRRPIFKYACKTTKV
mmetsp:Transcript_26409/g.52023  ORF Transcript_26409/g.52023 Transcript_26409/m.52023 type:complete len:849 (-) Transcript_26409:568-3114(-)